MKAVYNSASVACIETKSGAKMCLISFLCAKFEGYLIMHLHFMTVFASVQKEEKWKKMKKMSNFDGSYLRNGLRDLLQILYIFYSNIPALAQQIWSC